MVFDLKIIKASARQQIGKYFTGYFCLKKYHKALRTVVFIPLAFVATQVLATETEQAMTERFLASTVVMVPPTGLRFNFETAKSNPYQQQNKESKLQHKKAFEEFNQMVARLRKNNINVILLQQDKSSPDAVYPNNWFSTHISSNGKTSLIIYPLMAENRQSEINPENLMNTLKKAKISIEKVTDLRNQEGLILEGTGSMILDRKNHIIYASISPRTDKALVLKAANILNYKPYIFHATDENKKAIYHTNLLMSIAEKYAIICLECINSEHERANIVTSLQKTGKKLIFITRKQVGAMCGNVLDLRNKNNENILVLSQQAFEHLQPAQIKKISKYSKMLPMQISSIESVGGGSARCMIAEVFAN